MLPTRNESENLISVIFLMVLYRLDLIYVYVCIVENLEKVENMNVENLIIVH